VSFSVDFRVSAGCAAPDGTAVDVGLADAEFDSRRESMAAVCQSVRLTADLTMHVPRNTAGNLDSGAEDVVTGIDDVAGVEAVDVTGLEPRLNDLRIDATVTVDVTVDDAEPETAAREVLADGFGVECVDRVQVQRADADQNQVVQEYG
jgi:hypothetical protein